MISSDWIPLSRREEDHVYYYIGERLKLEGETENRGICAKKRISVRAGVLMATPCTKFVVQEVEVGDTTSSRKEARRGCWTYAGIIWSSLDGRQC